MAYLPGAISRPADIGETVRDGHDSSFVSPDTWREQRDSAPPTRYSDTRLDPGRGADKITHVRYDLRRFEVRPGKWVREFTIPIDLVSKSVSGKDRLGHVDKLQRHLDEHVNQRHHFSNGDQAHFVIEAKNAGDIAPGWDSDPARSVPVEVFDGAGKGGNQLAWDVKAPPESAAVLTFVGFDGQRGDIIGRDSTVLTPDDLSAIDRTSRDGAVDHGLGDHRPAIDPGAKLPQHITSNGPKKPPPGPNPPRGVTLGGNDRTSNDRTGKSTDIELDKYPKKTPPDGNGTTNPISDQIPPYLRDSRAGGPAKQPFSATGLNIHTGLERDQPSLRGSEDIARIERQVTDNVLSYLGRGLTETIMVDGRPMELTVKTSLDWDHATDGTAKDDPSKGKASGKSGGKTEYTADSSRDRDANLNARFTSMPPLVATLDVTAPTGPNTKHENKVTFDAARKSEVEIGALKPVNVPVTVTYSLIDAKGTNQAPHAEPSHGTVGLEVPTTLKDGGNPFRDLTQQPPKRFAVEEAVAVINEHGLPDFFQRAATGLAGQLKGVGASGRTVLQNFVHEANIKTKLPEMAVYNPGPHDGWVRSDALVKSPKSWSWSTKGSMFEMRVVARQVRVMDRVSDVKHTDTESAKTTATSKSTAKRTVGVEGHVGGGATAGAVTFSAGPTAAASHSREKAMESSLGANAKDTHETTGEATRYEVRYELQVRQLGHGARTVGRIDAIQWARQDRADNAGLTDGTTDPNANKQDATKPADTNAPKENPATDSTKPVDTNAHTENPPREVYGPAHLESLMSIGGTRIDNFDGNSQLRDTISAALHDVPGHKWYHFSSKKFVRAFDSPDFAGGLTNRINEILSRGQNLADHLTDPQLAQLVDTMLRPDGLTFEIVKKGVFWNYHTTVTLHANLANLHDHAPLNVDKTATTSKLKDKTGATFTAGKETAGGGGVQGRVVGPGMGNATGIWVGDVSYKRTSSQDASIGATNQEATVNTHGDNIKPDGKLDSRPMRPFTADLQITSQIDSHVRPNGTTRRVTFGSWGRQAPELAFPSPLPAHTPPAPHNVPLRLLVPESMVSTTPPDALDVKTSNVTPLTTPPKIRDLGAGMSRTFDNAEIVSVLGTNHFSDAIRRMLGSAAKNDQIFEAAPTGKKGERRAKLFTDEIEGRFSPDRLKNDPRLFSRPQVSRMHWDRRLADVDALAGVQLAPTNPRPLSAQEYRSVKQTTGSTTTVGKSGGVSNTVVQKNTFLASAPTTAAAYHAVKAQMTNIISVAASPLGIRWGNKTSLETEGVQKTVYEDGKLVKKTLVKVDVDAVVVGEAKRTGNIDKFGILPGEGTRAGGESFRVHDSVIMWATDEQLAVMNHEAPPPVGPNPAHEDGRTLPAPDSLVHGEKPSLGLGTVTSRIDLTDRIPKLHQQLRENLTAEVADRLLPSSALDVTHDNFGKLNDFLSNANRSVNSSLNGGDITPLRLEDKLSGKTYYLTVNSHFTTNPSFTGIEHGGSLKTQETAKFANTREKSHGWTAATVGAGYRPGFRLVDQQDPAAKNNPAHAPAGGIMQGGDLAADLGKRDVKTTESDKPSYQQSASTTGPLGAYHAKLGFDIRIERAVSLGADGKETAAEVVAHDTTATRDVDIVKLPEESFPEPTRGTYGAADAVTPVDPKTADTTAWHGDGKPLPPAGTFEAEHYFGDLADLRAAAEQSIVDSGAKVDTATVAALKAAITLPKIKAGLLASDSGKFVIPLPGGRSLEVHTRLSGEPRLASVSANVKIEGTRTETHESTVELKAGNEFRATGNVPAANVGGAPPEGQKGNFSSITGGSGYQRPLMSKETVLTAETGAPKKEAKTPLSTDAVKTADEVTQVNLHNVDFRFVTKGSSKTGIADLHVHDAFALRGNPDPAHPLPPSLVTAAKDLKDLGKKWDEAVQGARHGQSSAGPSRSREEQAWWEGRAKYEEELDSARRQWEQDHLPPEVRRERELAARQRDLDTRMREFEQRERERRLREEDNEARAAEEQDRRNEEREARQRRDTEEAERERARQEQRAAEEKRAAEKRAAEKRAAEEKAAAEKKAAEEKAAAERKAAEEKAAAEKKAAEEKAAEEKKAAEKKAAEEKAAAEKRAEERKAAEEKAARDQKAAEEKKAAERAAAERRAAEEKAAAEKRVAEEKRAAEEKAVQESTTGEKSEGRSEDKAGEKSEEGPKDKAEETKPATETKPTTETKSAEDAKSVGGAKSVEEAKSPGEAKPADDAKPDGQAKVAEEAKPAGEAKPSDEAAAQAERARLEEQARREERVLEQWRQHQDRQWQAEEHERQAALGQAVREVGDRSEGSHDLTGLDRDTAADGSRSPTEGSEDFKTAPESQSYVTAPESPDGHVTMAGTPHVPLDQLVDLSDVDFVPLRDSNGNTVGVAFPRAGEGDILQQAFRHGAGRDGAFTTLLHHDENGFAVTRRSDGHEIRLDEHGLARLLTSASLPGGQSWRQASELVFLSCQIADPALGNRLGALHDILQQHDYHGDVHGPDTRVTVFEDGHVDFHDGGSLHTEHGRGVTLTPKTRLTQNYRVDGPSPFESVPLLSQGKLGNRLGAVERLLREQDYHGDVRGPDTKVTVFEDGRVDYHGGSMRTAGDPPRLPEFPWEAGKFVEELMDDVDTRVPPEPPKLVERHGDWALNQVTAPVDAHSLVTEHGMSGRNQQRFQAMADRFGVVIDVRPTNPASVRWIEQGAVPKPMAIKAKTLDERDVHLGAPADKIGLVGYFDPTMPDPATLPDGLRDQVLARFDGRAQEFRALADDMRKLAESGEFRVRDGLVEARTDNGFRHITGDHDMFDIRLPDDGAALRTADYDNMVWLLQNRNMGVQHGAHMYWEPANPFAQKIYDDIVARHQNDEPLIRFAPGEPPRLVRLADDHTERVVLGDPDHDVVFPALVDLQSTADETTGGFGSGAPKPRPSFVDSLPDGARARADHLLGLDMTRSPDSEHSVVVERELVPQERRYRWHRDVPALLEMPRLVHSVLLGGAAGALARFRANLAHTARVAGDRWKVVVWTDIPRHVLLAALRTVRRIPVKHGFEFEDQDFQLPPDLTGVAEFYEWAATSNIALVNVDEVFNEDDPMDDHDDYGHEHSRGRHDRAARTAAKEILSRFGGVAMDPGHYARDLSGAENVVRSAPGWGRAGGAVAMPQGHPAAGLLGGAFQQDHPGPAPAGGSAGMVPPGGQVGVPGGSAGMAMPADLPLLDGFVPGDPATEPPLRHPLTELSVEDLSKRVIDVLVHQLRIDGNLDLTAVAHLVAGHPRASEVWTVVLAYLATRPELAGLVRAITTGTVPLPPQAAELIGDASLNWPDWL